MTGPMTAEPVRPVLLPQIERRALDVLPSERSTDGDAKVLTGDLIRPQPLEPQSRDTARRIPRPDAEIAQLAAETGRSQRSHHISLVELRGPRRRALTGVVVFRRQVRRILGARPDVGRQLR